MDDDGEITVGGEDENGAGGGGIPPGEDLDQQCQFIDGQFVCTPPEENPEEVAPPTQTECPTCDQIIPVPPSGTRGNYYWDSKKIIDNATKSLNPKTKK